MNNRLINTLIVLVISIGMLHFSSCKKDDEKEVVRAKFIVDSTTRDVNHPIFTSKAQAKDTSLSLYYYWSFGNGESSSEPQDSTIFDFPGYYNVVFQVTTSEGVQDKNDTMLYKVSQINPDLRSNPYLSNLAISAEDDYKNWVLSNKAGAMAIGSSAGIENGTGLDYTNDPIDITTEYPEDYLKTNSLNGDSAYFNVMSFDLQQYVFHNSGPSKNWAVNWSFANSEFGYNQPEGKDVCLDVTVGLDTNGYYYLDEKDDGTVFISLNNKNFLLYYEGKPSKTKYQVLALYNDLLVVRKPYFNANGEAIGYRILKYVPEGSTILPDKPLSVIDPPNGL